jgi:hypothetical protein
MGIDEQKARVQAELAREKADIAAAFDKASAKSKIPVDKLMHVAAGLLLWVAAYLLTRNIWVAAGAAVVVGAAKEVYDAKHPATHTADLKDFIATAAIPVLLSAGLWLWMRG